MENPNFFLIIEFLLTTIVAGLVGTGGMTLFMYLLTILFQRFTQVEIFHFPTPARASLKILSMGSIEIRSGVYTST